jgi:hypothetical protein
MKFNSHPEAFTQGIHFASGGNALLLTQLLACAAPDFDEISMAGVSDARWNGRSVAFVVSTLLAP